MVQAEGTCFFLNTTGTCFSLLKYTQTLQEKIEELLTIYCRIRIGKNSSQQTIFTQYVCVYELPVQNFYYLFVKAFKLTVLLYTS